MKKVELHKIGRYYDEKVTRNLPSETRQCDPGLKTNDLMHMK